MSKRTLRPEEAELWRRVVRHVVPYPGKTAPEPIGAVFLPASPAQPPRAGPALPNRPAPAPSPRAAMPDRGGEKRVRRGRLEIAAKLDLHGFFQDGAREALEIFLHRSTEARARVVLVITGKGLRQERFPKSVTRFSDENRSKLTYRPDSPGSNEPGSGLGRGEPQPGVLRTLLPVWLAAPHLRALVAGYAGAHAKHGGEGAFYVFLRRQSAD